MNTPFVKRHWALILLAIVSASLLSAALKWWTAGPYLVTALWQLLAATLGVFGAVVATEAWAKRVNTCGSTLWIIVGALFVAASSIVSTLGWNGLSDWKQAEDQAQALKIKRQDTLRLVAAEMNVNRQKLLSDAFSESDPESLKQPASYPRLQVVAIAQAITSGLFINESDRRLLTQLYELHDYLAAINAFIGRTEEGLLTVTSVQDMRTAL